MRSDGRRRTRHVVGESAAEAPRSKIFFTLA